MLLRNGEFWGREVELAALRGGTADPHAITVCDGVTLVQRDVQSQPTARGTRVEVELVFRIEPGAELPPALSMHCVGPSAARVRSFRVTADPVRWRFTFDSTFPPGRYDLSLQLSPRAAALPLETYQIAPTELTLSADASIPATQLYWSTAQPTQRRRPDDGVTLRSGDVLWKQVRRATQESSALVVVTTRPAQLVARLDGRALARLSRVETRAVRFALPTSGGLLEIRSSEGEPVVEEIFVLARATR